MDARFDQGLGPLDKLTFGQAAVEQDIEPGMRQAIAAVGGRRAGLGKRVGAVA
jgi:hypothetical protein